MTRAQSLQTIDRHRFIEVLHQRQITQHLTANTVHEKERPAIAVRTDRHNR